MLAVGGAHADCAATLLRHEEGLPIAPGRISASNGVSGKPTTRWLSVCTQIPPSSAVNVVSRPGSARTPTMTIGTTRSSSSSSRPAAAASGAAGAVGAVDSRTVRGGCSRDHRGRGRCSSRPLRSGRGGRRLRVRRLRRGDGRRLARRRGRRRAQCAVVAGEPLLVVLDGRARHGGLSRGGLPRQQRDQGRKDQRCGESSRFGKQCVMILPLSRRRGAHGLSLDYRMS